jgi:acetyltransferase-like isoleucine patch superfamily enzyme
MKAAIKSAARGLALLLVLPCYLAFRLGSLVLGSDKAFPGWSQGFSLIPGIAGVYLRAAFYRLLFPRCAADAWIGFGTVFSHSTVEVGARVYVGPYCSLGDVTLGDDVLLGSGVSVSNGSRQHGIARLDIPIREQPGEWPRITIGGDSWIGDRAVVLADVGTGCVVGAGSVVTRALPDYAVAVGAPAKVIRYRQAQRPVRHDLHQPESVSSSAGRPSTVRVANPLP